MFDVLALFPLVGTYGLVLFPVDAVAFEEPLLDADREEKTDDKDELTTDNAGGVVVVMGGVVIVPLP